MEGEGLGDVGSRDEDVVQAPVAQLVEVDLRTGRVDARDSKVGWYRWGCYDGGAGCGGGDGGCQGAGREDGLYGGCGGLHGDGGGRDPRLGRSSGCGETDGDRDGETGAGT